MNQHDISKAENGTVSSPETSSVRAERDFLHDLSNPLAVASGLLDLLNEDLVKQDQLTDQQRARFAKLSGSLERIRDLIKSRRMKLIEAEEDSANKKTG